jgi:hypothetical protein
MRLWKTISDVLETSILKNCLDLCTFYAITSQVSQDTEIYRRNRGQKCWSQMARHTKEIPFRRFEGQYDSPYMIRVASKCWHVESRSSNILHSPKIVWDVRPWVHVARTYRNNWQIGSGAILSQWRSNWLVTALSVISERNNKLDIDLNFSNNRSILSFFKMGFSTEIFQWSETRPAWKDTFTIFVTEGIGSSEYSLTSHDGSSLQLALAIT